MIKKRDKQYFFLKQQCCNRFSFIFLHNTYKAQWPEHVAMTSCYPMSQCALVTSIEFQFESSPYRGAYCHVRIFSTKVFRSDGAVGTCFESFRAFYRNLQCLFGTLIKFEFSFSFWFKLEKVLSSCVVITVLLMVHCKLCWNRNNYFQRNFFLTENNV